MSTYPHASLDGANFVAVLSNQHRLAWRLLSWSRAAQDLFYLSVWINLTFFFNGINLIS